MRIAYFGYADIGANCLSSLLNAGVAVEVVFTHPEQQEVRSGYKPKSVATLAEKFAIPLLVVEADEEDIVLKTLQEIHPDMLVSVNWRALFTGEMLDIPRHGALNVHGSLLPKYRGNAPVTWAIINGEVKTGATVHYIDTGMDTGDIITQNQVEITAHDTIGTVLEKLECANGELLVRAIKGLEDGSITPRHQDENQATIGKRRRPEDGVINWNQSAKEVYNWIRAITYPLPGAFSFYHGKRLVVWGVECIDLDVGLGKPGTIVEYSISFDKDNAGIVVACETGLIVIRNICECDEFLNEISELLKKGYFQKGESFESSQ